MEIPSLPPSLKKSEWQKHASIVAKVMPGKSSGIGDALAKVEAAHTVFKTAAAAYDPKTLVQTAGAPTQNPQHKALTEAVGRLSQAVEALSHQAKTSATAWKAKLSPVPKTTREYAETIEKSSETMGKALDKLIANLDHKIG